MSSREDASVQRHQLRVLAPLWLAATLVVDAACLAAVARQTRWQFGLLTATLLALAFSQISLAAIWAGLGAGRFLLRLITAVAVGAGWLGLLSLVGPNPRGLLALLGLQILCVCGPLLLARAFGIRLMHRDRIPLGRRPLQFGIAQIMLWTAIIAVLLGLGRVVPLPEQISDREMMLGPIFASLALLAVWAALGTSHVALRLMVVLSVSPLLGIGAQVFLMRPQPSKDNLLEFAVMTGLQGVLLAGSLWIFRLGGYRLTRRAPAAA
jgi:hypothetical protein